MKCKKKGINMSDRKSNGDLAYEFLKNSKEPKSFDDIWNYVCDNGGFNDEERKNSDVMSKFYTHLLLDGRFVTLCENMWDLRDRQPYDKIHIDLNAVYADVEEGSDESDDEDGDEVSSEDENIESEEY